MNGFERDWIDWWNWMLNRETSGNVLGGRSSGGRVLRPPQQIGAAVRLVEVFAAAGRFQQIPVRQVQRSRLPGTRSRQAAELPRCNNLSGQGHNLTGSLFDLDAADVMATWIEPRQKPVVWTSANAVAMIKFIFCVCSRLSWPMSGWIRARRCSPSCTTFPFVCDRRSTCRRSASSWPLSSKGDYVLHVFDGRYRSVCVTHRCTTAAPLFHSPVRAVSEQCWIKRNCIA